MCRFFVLLAWLLASSISSLLAQEISFSEHVFPIIRDKCAPCHNDLGSAPFPLTNYKQVSRYGRFVKLVTETDYMPLWKGDISFRRHANARYLSKEEKSLIAEWYDQGMPKGDTTAPLSYNYSLLKPILGEPDMVFELDSPLVIPGDNEEHYMLLKIPYEIDEHLPIKAIEFESDHRSLIHHCGFFVVRQRNSYPNLNDGDDRFYYPITYNEINEINRVERDFNALAKLNIVPPGKLDFWNIMTVKSAWQNGMIPPIFPDSMGFVFPKKGAIIIDAIHYLGTPEEIKDNIKFNIYLHDEPIARKAISVSLGNGPISTIEPPLIIEPEAIQRHHSKAILPGDMSLFDISPHMHELGKEFVAYAIRPNGDTIPLVKINDWDFSWQDAYRFNPMLHLPQGSEIYFEGLFDNTSNNPKNPSSPPRKVGYSMMKHDEMLEMIITFFEYQPGDETRVLDIPNK